MVADLPAMLGAMWAPLLTGKMVIAGPIAERAQDLELLMQLAADGKLKPVIEKRFAFEQLVEAHRHVDTERKKGNVVVRVTA